MNIRKAATRPEGHAAGRSDVDLPSGGGSWRARVGVGPESLGQREAVETFAQADAQEKRRRLVAGRGPVDGRDAANVRRPLVGHGNVQLKLRRRRWIVDRDLASCGIRIVVAQL